MTIARCHWLFAWNPSSLAVFAEILTIQTCSDTNLLQRWALSRRPSSSSQESALHSWRKWWDLELRRTLLCFLSRRLEEKVGRAAFDVGSRIKAEVERRLQGTSAQRWSLKVAAWTPKMCLVLFYWSLWNKLRVLLCRYCAAAPVTGWT